MAPRVQNMTQTEVTKLLKAAAKAGLKVRSLESNPDRVVLRFDESAPVIEPPSEDAADLI